MDKKKEFLKRIFATFKIEAEENINRMSADLIELEKGCSDTRKSEILEVMFRSAHSLKGASRAVNLVLVEKICHSFENVMSSIQNEKIKLSQDVFDLLNQTIDLLNEAIVGKNGNEHVELSEKVNKHIANLYSVEIGVEKPSPSIDIIQKTKEQDTTYKRKTQQKEIFETSISNQPVLENVPEGSSASENLNFNNNSSNETIRISTKKLDNVLIQAEEMLTIKLDSAQRTDSLNILLNKWNDWHKKVSEINGAKVSLQQFLNKKGSDTNFLNAFSDIEKIVQFQDWTNSYLKNIEDEIRSLRNKSQIDDYAIGIKTENILDDVKELITVPFSIIMDGFPKMVRDLARDTSKKIDFSVSGDTIEIDRRILEIIKTPIMHILRNSIDYGIEESEIRIDKNKPEKGKIKIEINRFENSTVEIVISDDGNGINLEKLKELYIKDKNIPNEAIDDIPASAYLKYIFKSGISTSKMVTDLSGRGLGLAIVEEAVEQLRGSVDVETEAGSFTRFRMVLPVSILRFRGVHIMVSGMEFIIPTTHLKRVLKIHKNEIKTVEKKTTIKFNEEIIPLVVLGDILELNMVPLNSDYFQIMVLEYKDGFFGFIVDKIIGEKEVLVKKFNKQLTKVRNVSGATVLGSGKVIPILTVSDLCKSVSKNINTANSLTAEVNADDTSQKFILLVEDSITSRTLLKNILETSGYQVTIAVDGIDGFTKLKEGEFDAVISDVEMPRMSGFELTEKIRRDDKYGSIPVVLVTSLSKKEHKEKGIDVGANAYIVKSNFEQSNLIEILERLI